MLRLGGALLVRVRGRVGVGVRVSVSVRVRVRVRVRVGARASSGVRFRAGDQGEGGEECAMPGSSRRLTPLKILALPPAVSFSCADAVMTQSWSPACSWLGFGLG